MPPAAGWTSASMPAPSGATFLGPMAVARNSDGRLEIFALAADPADSVTPGDIYHASQIEATDGPPNLVETGIVTIRGVTQPVFAAANADLWSDLATPLWASLGRPPNGGVLINDEGLRGADQVTLPQPVLSAAQDSLGQLVLCVVGADGSLHSRSQTAPSDSSSWGPWTGSQPPQTPVSANLAVVTSGNAVFAFLVGTSVAANEIIYYVQDGSGQPWSGPFALSNPTANGTITALAAATDGEGGIILVVTTDFENPSPGQGSLFSNHLPQALNAAWAGWTALPLLPNGLPLPAVLLQMAWADGFLYLVLSLFAGSTLYYIRYGQPPAPHPSGTRQPAWATGYGTVVGPPSVTGIQSWAADAWDGPLPNTEGPRTTAVFYVDPQSSLWVVGFEYTRPIGLNPPNLVPSAPFQIDTMKSGYGELVATLWPFQAVTKNASDLWEVFCIQSNQCLRWIESPAG